MSQTLMILRGVQGAGKTTLAEFLVNICGPDRAAMFAADDYFVQSDGTYAYDVDKLQIAHSECLANARAALEAGVQLVIVHNTFQTEMDIVPYQALAENVGARFVSVVVENRHGSSDVHGVPRVTRERASTRIRNSLKLV